MKRRRSVGQSEIKCSMCLPEKESKNNKVWGKAGGTHRMVYMYTDAKVKK